ncbi:MAG: hypothetical protein WC992_07045 [Acholeplasmataceae bacterium]|jgi:hypothetical protein|nr:hypothetical protein [Acholeplasmataceae bacterium]
MRKIFEKPMIHYTFVLTVVAIVCGLMIGGMNAITAPIIKRNLEEAQRRAYQQVLPEGQDFMELDLIAGVPSSIQSAVEAKDASSQVIGYIYTAYMKNQHGSITIVVSADTTGKILGTSILAIDQTKGIDDTRNNLNGFVGSNLGVATPIGDITAGVTNSLNTIKALILDMSIAHGLLAGAPADPYVDAYGEGYSLDPDDAFEPTDHVISRKIATNASDEVVGYVYYLTGTGDYEGYGGEVFTGKGIDLEVLFDAEYEVIGVFIPEDEYEHTKSFRERILSYAESFIGKKPIDFAPAMLDPEAIAAGASFTRNLVNVLLDALLEEVN